MVQAPQFWRSEPSCLEPDHQSAPPEPRFDLVFCDPPYDAAPRIVQPLADLLPRVTAPQALIVTESSKRNPLVLDLPLSDERIYGDTRIAIHHGR